MGGTYVWDSEEVGIELIQLKQTTNAKCEIKNLVDVESAKEDKEQPRESRESNNEY